MKNIKKEIKITDLPFLIIISSLALYFTSIHSFILFHTITELFTIIIAFGIFAIAWSSRRFIDNNFLLIIGISYFFIGGIDLIHTLSYKGIEVFAGYGTNLPTQLWIIDRYLEAISFVVALLFLREKSTDQDNIRNAKLTMKKADRIFLVYLVFFVLIIISVFYLNIFPVAYVDGSGITEFKKISEYVISFIFLVSIILLFKKKGAFGSQYVQSSFRFFDC